MTIYKNTTAFTAMFTDNKDSQFRFLKPAVYKIAVEGKLDESWSSRLGGMQISYGISNDGEPVSVLIGQLNDQSALSGVLNTLHDYHISIISMSTLKEDIEN